jgi:hypothetical protein
VSKHNIPGAQKNKIIIIKSNHLGEPRTRKVFLLMIWKNAPLRRVSQLTSEEITPDHKITPKRNRSPYYRQSDAHIQFAVTRKMKPTNYIGIAPAAGFSTMNILLSKLIVSVHFICLVRRKCIRQMYISLREEELKKQLLRKSLQWHPIRNKQEP